MKIKNIIQVIADQSAFNSLALERSIAKILRVLTRLKLQKSKKDDFHFKKLNNHKLKLSIQEFLLPRHYINLVLSEKTLFC